MKYPIADLDMSQLDPGVRSYVATLRENGIETFESRHGDDGHCGPECFVKVSSYDLMAAVTVARNHDWPLIEVRDTCGGLMNIGDSYEVRDNSGKFLWTGSIVKITRKWFYLQEPTVGAHIHFRQSDGRSVMTVDGGLWASPAANPTA